MYPMNPGARRMWMASDAELPGSGAALEKWALGEIQKASSAGQLDLNDSTALRGFLGSLGITPEKGGGRALFMKFTGPESPLAGLKANAAPASAKYGDPSAMANGALRSRYGVGSTLGDIGYGSPSYGDESLWG